MNEYLAYQFNTHTNKGNGGGGEGGGELQM